mmetsp:Transcript_64804/g.187847  ORF Transcript_64804/g.187847 Transcript_64804/m.187847 type:complete len:216 (-) Transcript_64804:157-804(-)
MKAFLEGGPSVRELGELAIADHLADRLEGMAREVKLRIAHLRGPGMQGLPTFVLSLSQDLGSVPLAPGLAVVLHLVGPVRRVELAPAVATLRAPHGLGELPRGLRHLGVDLSGEGALPGRGIRFAHLLMQLGLALPGHLLEECHRRIRQRRGIPLPGRRVRALVQRRRRGQALPELLHQTADVLPSGRVHGGGPHRGGRRLRRRPSPNVCNGPLL